jgi:hypothetical protein
LRLENEDYGLLNAMNFDAKETTGTAFENSKASESSAKNLNSQIGPQEYSTVRNSVRRDESSRTRDQNDTGCAYESGATSAVATGRLEPKSFGGLGGPAAVTST